MADVKSLILTRQTKPFCVYALLHPITLKEMYVGHTQDLHTRMYVHLTAKGKSIRDKWIRLLGLSGLRPKAKILDEFETRAEAEIYEKNYIETKRLNNIYLINGTGYRKQTRGTKGDSGFSIRYRNDADKALFKRVGALMRKNDTSIPQEVRKLLKRYENNHRDD